MRENKNGRFVFLMNFNNTPVKVDAAEKHEILHGSLPELPPYGVTIMKVA
jgi:hypothetical protein